MHKQVHAQASACFVIHCDQDTASASHIVKFSDMTTTAIPLGPCTSGRGGVQWYSDYVNGFECTMREIVKGPLLCKSIEGV